MTVTSGLGFGVYERQFLRFHHAAVHLTRAFCGLFLEHRLDHIYDIGILLMIRATLLMVCMRAT